MSRELESASNGLVDADECLLAVYARTPLGVYDGLSYKAIRMGCQLPAARGEDLLVLPCYDLASRARGWNIDDALVW